MGSNGGNERKYTDEQIKFICDKKNEGKHSWPEIAEAFEAEFCERKTHDAVRKAYDVYKNLDLSDDQYLSNLKEVHSTKRNNSYTAKENKVLVENLVTFDMVKEELQSMLNKTKIVFQRPAKRVKKHKKTNRVLLAHLSDTHYGSSITSGEMSGLNKYDDTIAARRTALFFKQLCDYKRDYRDDTELALVINGDLLSGVIHISEGSTPIVKQLVTTMSILGQGISYLSNNFKKVTVYVNTGNHDRFQHSQDKGRVSSMKWNSFASVVYYSLKEKFNTYKNVKFVIPESPYCTFNIFSHRVFSTHGDNVFSVGSPGKSVKVGDIATQIDKINNSDLGKDNKFNLFLIAHVHQPMFLLLNNGAHVLINGSLSGTDPFAQSVGIFGNHPSQQFVEVTEEFIGDFRLVSVKKADEDASLDQIIKVSKELF